MCFKVKVEDVISEGTVAIERAMMNALVNDYLAEALTKNPNIAKARFVTAYGFPLNEDPNKKRYYSVQIQLFE